MIDVLEFSVHSSCILSEINQPEAYFNRPVNLAYRCHIERAETPHEPLAVHGADLA